MRFDWAVKAKKLFNCMTISMCWPFSWDV